MYFCQRKQNIKGCARHGISAIIMKNILDKKIKNFKQTLGLEVVDACSVESFLDELLYLIHNDTKYKTKKFNVHNFCGNDKLRPMLMGVYHEEGYKVATNAITLVCHKETYDTQYEGKTITKDGEILNVKYPNAEYVNYKGVVPKKEVRERMTKKTLDKKVLGDIFADYSKLKKVKVINKKNPFDCVVKVETKENPIYFNINEFEKIYSYMCETDNFTLYVPNNIDKDGIISIVDNADAGFALICAYRFDEDKYKYVPNKDDFYKVYEV